MECNLDLQPGSASLVKLDIVIVEVFRADKIIVFDLEEDLGEVLFFIILFGKHEEWFVVGAGGVKIVLVNKPVPFDTIFVENCGTQKALDAFQVLEPQVVQSDHSFLLLPLECFQLDLVSVEAVFSLKCFRAESKFDIAFLVFFDLDGEVASFVRDKTLLAKTVNYDHIGDVDHPFL